MPPKIVLLDANTISDSAVYPPLEFDHEWISYGKTSKGETLERLNEASICITNKVNIDSDILTGCPGLKFVAVAATGTNNIDLDACRDHGVLVSNVPSYASTSVAEHVFSMILSLRRNLTLYREELLLGKWQEAKQFCFFNEPILDLNCATMGIVGTGSVARSVGEIAKCFGMKVLYHSVSGRASFSSGCLVDFEYLLTHSDILSLHCPLTNNTRNLLSAAEIEMMKPGALLINTARGPIVDLSALKRALDNRAIAGAGLDVAPQEPPEINDIFMQLASYPNVVATPHVAWASQQSTQALVNKIVENIKSFVVGSPINVVN